MKWACPSQGGCSRPAGPELRSHAPRLHLTKQHTVKSAGRFEEHMLGRMINIVVRCGKDSASSKKSEVRTSSADRFAW